MQTYHTTQTWGYKIHTPQQISFYHVLLDHIPLYVLPEHIPEIASIQKQGDGSITIQLFEEKSNEEVVKKLLAFFNQKSLDFFETPKMYYKIPTYVRQSLLSWALAFEGCLALLLLANQKTLPFFNGQWEYINSNTGGIYLSPFTIFLYEDHPKIIHPITLQNFSARKNIEQTTAMVIRKMFRRIEEAHRGLEGIALLSMVKEKTVLPSYAITKIINDKSFQIRAPIFSPFFFESVI